MKEHCCAICGALLAEGSDPYVLYHSEKTDEESFACPECARLLRKLMEEEDAAALKHALNYFTQYTERIRQIEDKELLAVLLEIFEDAVKLVRQKDQAIERERRRKPD